MIDILVGVLGRAAKHEKIRGRDNVKRQHAETSVMKARSIAGRRVGITMLNQQ